MTPWMLVAAGGALGALSRYAIDRGFETLMGYPTVIGVFSINIGGAFLLGVFVSASGSYSLPTPGARLFLATGFLGSYTTFSTLAVATTQLAESGDLTRAALNIIGSMAVGLLAAFAGLALGRVI
jgi:CrcB protein